MIFCKCSLRSLKLLSTAPGGPAALPRTLENWCSELRGEYEEQIEPSRPHLSTIHSLGKTNPTRKPGGGTPRLNYIFRTMAYPLLMSTAFSPLPPRGGIWIFFPRSQTKTAHHEVILGTLVSFSMFNPPSPWCWAVYLPIQGRRGGGGQLGQQSEFAPTASQAV